MENNTPDIRTYLTQKNILFREVAGELITKCLFGPCDNESRDDENHLYFKADTGQYYCQKCHASGNLITLARYLGDNAPHWLPTKEQKPPDEIKDPDSQKALRIWEIANEASIDFPYLKKKKVLPHGVRIFENRLVLPLYARDGSLSSLQFISSDGDKKFLAGATTTGCFLLLGTPSDKLCIAEGFATAASVFEATGYAVAIAFSSGNLKATAEEIQKQFPNTKIIICSDTDISGLKIAKEVATEIGVWLAIPEFNQDEIIEGKIPTDFNDLHVLKGLSAVKAVIENAKNIPKKFGFTSLGDLLNEPDEKISWVVNGILPSGGFSIIAAKPKVGKSTLARQLALCIARGETFLGYQTAKGAVLYVSLEEKRGEIKNHFKLLGATGDEDLHLYVGSAPDKANEWLEKEVKSRKPLLVIIDTLFRFARVTSVNEYAEVIKALDPLLALARDNGAHLMVIHHARKSGGDGGDSTLGSTAIFGSVDTAIILKKTEGKRTIETEQRYGTNIESTLLTFDEASKSIGLGGTKEQDDILRISTEILDFLGTTKVLVDESAINAEVEGRTILKRKALRELLAQGKVRRDGAGKRGDPFLYSCFLVPDIYMGQAEQETGALGDVVRPLEQGKEVAKTDSGGF